MDKMKRFVKKLIPGGLFASLEPYWHFAEAVFFNFRYGFPGRKMRAIGVTGTNGKTTTSLMIQKMLHASGIKAGVLSTVAYGFGDNIMPQQKHITTLPASSLQKHLKDFAARGAEWVVVETSSHGLAQNRVWGIPFEVGVLTNLTHDHLDYHKTMKRYSEAKRRLFKIVSRHGLRTGVVNAESKFASKFIKTAPRAITYGLQSGQLRAENIKTFVNHSTFTARIGDESYKIRVNIPGEFNIYNALAAVAVGRELGLGKGQIEQGIASLKQVEGRMSSINRGQKFNVVVDFASTPDAFEKFFESIRPLVKGKLVAVFGSAGLRDESKRATQGEVAGKFADEVVLTEEDDRAEDGMKIINQIALGVKKSGLTDGRIHKIANREEAIGLAMTLVKNQNDMVVILGKGHEKVIERADGEYPWSDIEVASAALESLDKA